MAARQRFAAYAWFVLAFSLAVIVWGALVRATRSGAGCGENWPLCNGQVVPSAPVLSTIIEFTHRVTSGPVLGVFILVLAIAAFRVFPAGHVVRRTASLGVLFTVTEALIGAALVRLGHVADNSSGWRGVTLSIHLTNTLVLLAALALTAWFATHAAPQRPVKAWSGLALAIAGVLLLSVTGAIAALGDTLFATSSLAEGFRRDFAPGAPFFVRLRIVHPVLAVAVGAWLVAMAGRTILSSETSATAKRLGRGLIALTLAQIAIGAANLLLLAPLWIQLLHLLVADLVWISVVLLSVAGTTGHLHAPNRLHIEPSAGAEPRA
jgi:heme A synthase